MPSCPTTGCAARCPSSPSSRNATRSELCLSSLNWRSTPLCCHTHELKYADSIHTVVALMHCNMVAALLWVASSGRAHAACQGCVARQKQPGSTDKPCQQAQCFTTAQSNCCKYVCAAGKPLSVAFLGGSHVTYRSSLSAYQQGCHVRAVCALLCKAVTMLLLTLFRQLEAWAGAVTRSTALVVTVIDMTHTSSAT